MHAFTGGVLSDARSRYASHDLCKRSGVAIGSTLEMFGAVNARLCDLADQGRSKVGSAPTGPRSSTGAVVWRRNALGVACTFRTPFSGG